MPTYPSSTYPSSTVTLWGPTAYSISLLLIATPFVLYYTQTSIMYTITPSSCDSVMFANESSWYTGPWIIIPAYGVCPEETYSYTQVAGYAYHDCMEFSMKSKWEIMDTENAAEGYVTYLSDGASVWKRSNELLIIGTVCLFLIPFAVIGLGSGEDEDQALVIFTLLAAVPVALFVALDMFVSVQSTDQIKPEAWALVMFESCDVTITTTYGLYLVMYVIAVCGVLVVTSYGYLVYTGYIEYRNHLQETQAAAAEGLDSSNNNAPPGNPMLVSRSWYYGRTAPRETTLGLGRSDEVEALLPGNGEISRDKPKDDARLYQTAVEYRVDRNDFYPLPSAPASSIHQRD